MNKIIICVCLAITFVMTNAMPADVEFKEPLKIRGGVRKLDGDDLNEAKETLEFSLQKLSEGEQALHYKLDKIHSATKQVVSGIKYKINADLIVNDQIKKSNITIWSQPWLDDGIEVRFEFENEEPIVRKHSA